MSVVIHKILTVYITAFTFGHTGKEKPDIIEKKVPLPEPYKQPQLHFYQHYLEIFFLLKIYDGLLYIWKIAMSQLYL